MSRPYSELEAMILAPRTWGRFPTAYEVEMVQALPENQQQALLIDGVRGGFKRSCEELEADGAR